MVVLGTSVLCLQRAEFAENVSKILKDMKSDQYFLDVTLICEDGQISAHKVVLSACSPVFQGILRKNPHQHPLMYLKGVKFIDLLNLLDLIYLGKALMNSGNIDSFLDVAREFKVEGLCEIESKGSPEESTTLNGKDPGGSKDPGVLPQCMENEVLKHDCSSSSEPTGAIGTNKVDRGPTEHKCGTVQASPGEPVVDGEPPLAVD